MIETNFRMILPPGHASFLRGSDDYGCSNMFAGAMVLCVLFGFLASWHLTIRLSESEEPPKSAFRDFLRTLWVLKFHLLAFPLGAWSFADGCDAMWGNDFRNSFVLVGVVYVLTMAATLMLYRWRFSETSRALLGPAAVALWLVVGSDGMTPKTWHHWSGEQMTVSTTSRRQSLMKRWYELCERTLGPHQRSLTR